MSQPVCRWHFELEPDEGAHHRKSDPACRIVGIKLSIPIIGVHQYRSIPAAMVTRWQSTGWVLRLAGGHQARPCNSWTKRPPRAAPRAAGPDETEDRNWRLFAHSGDWRDRAASARMRSFRDSVMPWRHDTAEACLYSLPGVDRDAVCGADVVLHGRMKEGQTLMKVLVVGGTGTVGLWRKSRCTQSETGRQ